MSNLKRAQTSIVTRARRTELIDAQEVLNLTNNQTCELFGPNCRELGKLFELMYSLKIKKLKILFVISLKIIFKRKICIVDNSRG